MRDRQDLAVTSGQTRRSLSITVSSDSICTQSSGLFGSWDNKLDQRNVRPFTQGPDTAKVLMSSGHSLRSQTAVGFLSLQ